MSKQNFIKGTFILTCTGLASRVIGFFYRIFLSHSIGAQGLGLYQLMVPLQNLVLALTTSGIQTALNRLIASQTALKHHREAKNIFCTGLLTAFSLSVGASWILYTNSDFFAGQILKQPLTEPLLQILSFSFPLSAIHSCINSYYFARKKNRHSFRTAASGAACPGKLFLSDLPDPDFPEQACYRIHCRRRRPCFRAFCRICRASADCGRVFQRTVFLFSGAQFCSKAQGNLSYLFSAYPEPGASDTAWKH